MLDPIVSIQREMCLIAINLPLIVQLFAFGFYKNLGNFVIDHNKTVILIKRVYIPQIYLFHFYSPSRCWLVSVEQEGGGGLRHLGETRQPALFIWLKINMTGSFWRGACHWWCTAKKLITEKKAG
jgi:hypothetical protein